MSKTIKLNVSGKEIETYRSTLEKCSYFKNKMERWNEKELIDKDYKTFLHFLNILRDENYVVPEKYAENVEVMADFYGYGYAKHIQVPEKVKNYVYDCITITEGRRLDNYNDFDIHSHILRYKPLLSVCFKISGKELTIRNFELQIYNKMHYFGNMFNSYFTKEQGDTSKGVYYTYTSTKIFNKIFNSLLKNAIDRIKIKIEFEKEWSYDSNRLDMYISGMMFED